MNKYIQDSIRNASRNLKKGLTVPQKKALNEVIRGIYVNGNPILRYLCSDENKVSKRQGDKYSYHLGRIELKEKVEQNALKKVNKEIKRNTIIAYDLTDIAKPSAKKMENLSMVFDGSKRKKSKGYYVHGVGVNNHLIKLELHKSGKTTVNTTRKEIVKDLSRKFEGKGIWVFDRGNDGKQLFKALHHELKVDFICRLRENRSLVDKETGAIVKLKKLPEGIHKVYLLDKNNNKADRRKIFTIVIKKNKGYESPIRLIHNLKGNYTARKIVQMYLQRWGLENLFKRGKTKFELEKIRVLSLKKIENLTAIIQFLVNVSLEMFMRMQKITSIIMAGLLGAYRNFLKKKSLTFNVESFISFVRNRLKKYTEFKPKINDCNQSTLFSEYVLKKMVPF